MKKLWNRLQPCEKKATAIVGIITAVCLVTVVAVEIHDKKNGGAN